MVESDHIKPLAPSSDHQTSDDDHEAPPSNPKHHHRNKRRCIIKCCAIISTILILIAITIIILIFTVFKVKDPIITMNNVTINTLNLINGSSTMPQPGSNMSITADVSVKNPNYASFKYQNTTTTILYHGSVIGEAKGPPGQAKARRTMGMNITVDIITDRVLGNPNLGSDMISGLIEISSFTRVGGRVKFLNIIKRHVTVKMNCTVSVNITSRAIQEQKCKRKVSL